MSTEFTSLMSTGMDIRVIRSLHHLLLEWTSNRKDIQEKLIKKGRGKKAIKKVSVTNEKSPDCITIGKGSQKREYYDPAKNALITEYYN